MKRFKQFVEETKGDKDIVNGHGLHSLTPKEKKEFLKFKESKHKLKENNSSNFFVIPYLPHFWVVYYFRPLRKI